MHTRVANRFLHEKYQIEKIFSRTNTAARKKNTAVSAIRRLLEWKLLYYFPAARADIERWSV